MTFFHAVMWLDHETAQVLQLHADEVQEQHLKAHHHSTRQHGSEVRTQHEFFGNACDSLGGVGEVLVLGPHQALTDFRHYVDKHRSALAPHIVGWEPAQRMTKGQLIAHARRYFDKYDRLASEPASTL